MQGTTISVVQALERERRRSGRDWQVVGYEAMTNAATRARRAWEAYPNVQVVRELVLTEDDLEDYILPFVEGPVQDGWPGREFYSKFYEATSTNTSRYKWNEPACICEPQPQPFFAVSGWGLCFHYFALETHGAVILPPPSIRAARPPNPQPSSTLAT